ncbi:hypothetical protein F4560_006480 [Saccharothrix ecbatanensis]|uniref:Secreted protein n=1 Tax=Saccharothrix ecbatanensis TaxID=1105145 RepID=A0A7W9M443_9PSEU|nr:hypothetical protein [Saccharothrix ecbatanensis]MBB5806712.1 hypothetical protein [Saccharothrix ecbatanensis]
MIRRTFGAVFVAALLVGFGGSAVAAESTEFAWPPADITPVHETVAQLEVRTAGFSAREVELVPRVVRGASDVRTGAWGHEAAGLFDGQQYVNNDVRFTTPRGATGLFVQIHAPGFFTTTPAGMCEMTTCTGSVRLADGGLVLFTEYAPGEWGARTAYSYRPNGEVVYVSTGYSSVVSNRQLALLATDRAFTFAS